MRRETENQQQQPGFRLNLGEYWRVIWRKKYFLLVPLIISAIVSNVGIRFLIPIYASSTVIRVDQGGAVTKEIGQYVGETDRRSRDAETIMNLEADLKGSAFLDELIRNLGMDRDPRLIMEAEESRRDLYPGFTTEELVFRRLRIFLKQRISVEREGPGLYRLQYADANPEACFVVAQAMTDLYIDMQRRAKIQGLREVGDFSDEQLAVYKERLQRSERALETFQRNMARQTVEVNPVGATNVGVAETIKDDLELTMRNAESTLARIRSRLVELIGRVPEGDKVFSDGDLLKASRTLTARREAELSAQLAGGVGIVQTEGINESLQQIQRRLLTLVTSVFADISADYRPLIIEYFYQQIEIDAYRQKEGKLTSYLSAFREQVALAPQMQSELTRLQQAVDHNRSIYNTFLGSQTSTQIRESVMNTELGASVVIVEAAARPIDPVEPDPMKIMILALVFGLTMGGSGLLLNEFSDSSFRSVEEVERELGLKVLGTVPRFEHETRWYEDKSRKRIVLWAATSVVIVAVALSGFYFYGQSMRNQMIDLKLSRTTSQQ